jgi:crossover junction endodeoxyribonuclease RuvC
MRILGIDPGLLTTGFGLIDAEGAQMQYVASGTISTQHLDSRLLPQRLKVLFDGIGEVIKRYEPDVSACELLIRPYEVLSCIANVAILEVAHHALVVLLQHRHVVVGRFA